MKHTVRILLFYFYNLIYRLYRAELAVYRRNRNKYGIVSDKTFKMLDIYLTVSSDVNKVNLPPLLLKICKRSADGRMLKRS